MDKSGHAAGELLENACIDYQELEASADSVRSKVRLPCTGEVIDAASIGLVVVRSSDSDAEVIEFLCPRCERLHESVTFQ